MAAAVIVVIIIAMVIIATTVVGCVAVFIAAINCRTIYDISRLVTRKGLIAVILFAQWGQSLRFGFIYRVRYAELRSLVTPKT